MYKDTKCLLQAHRGVSTDAPENTMAAFRAAIEQGYDIIEFDPKYTRDGVWVVHHDMTLNRTGRVAGKSFEAETDIRDVSYAALADVDVGEWFAPQFTGERIPTFSQALDFMREKGIEGKIDNVYERFSLGAQKELFDLVERHADTTKMGLTSTKVSQLAAYGARFPHAPLHYDGAVSEESLDALKEISEGHTVTVWMHMGTPLVAWSKLPPATPEIVAAVKARGFRMGIWILENDEEMQGALALGADVVETTGGIKPN